MVVEMAWALSVYVAVHAADQVVQVVLLSSERLTLDDGANLAGWFRCVYCQDGDLATHDS